MSRAMPEPRAMVNDSLGNEYTRIHGLVLFNPDCTNQTWPKDDVVAVV
jgi:hypothetical protein